MGMAAGFEVDVDAVRAWLEKEEPRWTGESGAREMRRLALLALEDIENLRVMLAAYREVAKAVGCEK